MASAESAMRQYCSVCKSTFDMEVVRESAEDGVIWLRCPNCQGILPHMPGIAAPSGADESTPDESGSVDQPAAGSGAGDVQEGEAPKKSEATDPPPSPAADLLDEIDPEVALPYVASGTYEVGQVVHHRAWNDYGIVQACETLPGNRKIIRVRFVNAGEVQLLQSQED